MRDLEAIALLQDPARRSLYEYVVGQGREVSRNEAAEAVGLQRTLAAFHLDRLAQAGLLEVDYRRLTSRAGPGAGRPAKLYRRAKTERTYSAPPRDYARAARVFAEAIQRLGAEPLLYDVARAQGLAASRSLARNADGADRFSLDELIRHLTAKGYEPYAEAGSVRLRNCPFDALAREFAAVTCGMNLALVEGMLDGADLSAMYEARLEPRPGECCVSIASKTNVS
ncbi:MAG: transcriptional regulator [Chloroflexi bacterium]|nr:transcriptional regulator [Chloroflexota bacterium]MBV9602866.1 transcriptional regulator [Chloroflexota bacterium]